MKPLKIINTAFISECAAFLMNKKLVEFYDGKVSITDEGYWLLKLHTNNKITDADLDAIKYLIDNGEPTETFDSFAERLNLHAAVASGINEYMRITL